MGDDKKGKKKKAVGVLVKPLADMTDDDLWEMAKDIYRKLTGKEPPEEEKPEKIKPDEKPGDPD